MNQFYERCTPAGSAGKQIAALCFLAFTMFGGSQAFGQSSANPNFHVAPPSIPNKVFDVAQYGAVNDGKTIDTEALQKAIDTCSASGGGEVKVPAGRYLTGPLHLASEINLHLDAGATILISDNTSDFKLSGPEGKQRYEDCIVGSKLHDIAITGSGVIDGQGDPWWKTFAAWKYGPAGMPEPPHRPFLMVLTGCQRVLIQGITLQNSPMFHLVPQKCQDVHIDGIHISSPDYSKNTDGIDPSGWRYLIENSTIDVGDDCIALKPSGRIDASEPACRDFLIQHMTFLHGHGMSVGGQTPGGLENLTVRDSTFQGTDAGIRLKAPRGSGGLVENLSYRNLKMTGVKVPILITSYYSDNGPTSKPLDPAQDPAQAITDRTPIWRNIDIENVTATDAKIAGEIFGLAEMPVSDITLKNVSIQARNGFQIIHARNIEFSSSKVAATNGAPVVLEDAQVTGISRSGQAVANLPADTKGQRIFDVAKYGAIADGKTDDSAAIAQAIAACTKSGGGQVLLRAGEYSTGPVQLMSNVDLHLDGGAVVTFTTDHSRYPLILSHYEGLQAVRSMSPIYGDGLQNVSITGEGVFDGQGQTWRPAKKDKLPESEWNTLITSGYVEPMTQTWWPSQAAAQGGAAVAALQSGADSTNTTAYEPYRDFLRPTLVELDNCRGVVLDGPTFRNSPAWNIHIALSDNVTVKNITSFNYFWAQNGDGIDLDSCRHVAMTDCTINAGDDGICLKSGKDEEGRKLGRPTEDVAIDHCTVFKGHGGLSIGSEMSGGVRKVSLTHCVFDGTDVGLRLKSTRGRGGMVDDVVASNVDMYDIAGPAISFDMYYMVKNPQPEPVSERTPRFQNFRISNIDCDGAKSAILVRGLPEMPIEDVKIENVAIRANAGVTCIDAKNIAFKNVAVTVGNKPTDILTRTIDTTQTASHVWQDDSGLVAAVPGNGG